MFDELRKYKNNDHFFLKKGDLLSAECEEVPEMRGYII